MTITTCDICNDTISHSKITVEFLDGKHPHNGSTMYRRADCCPRCTARLTKLSCHKEITEVRSELLGENDQAVATASNEHRKH